LLKTDIRRALPQRLPACRAHCKPVKPPAKLFSNGSGAITLTER
jgi:hypothetical protein